MHISHPMCRVFALFMALLPELSYAAEIDGRQLTLWWISPFVLLLLSIALLPLLTPRLWHHHYGKVVSLLAMVLMIAQTYYFGWSVTLAQLAHALIGEYLSFILLLLALFTVSGGILIKGNWHGSPRLNCALLALGALLASFMGTTGAAMLMIRPLIRANDNRRHQVHIIIFFIFLVANIGGGLTPLGDPPLFIGFLKGVNFFWTLQHMLLPVILASVILLFLFYLIDSYYSRQADEWAPHDRTPTNHKVLVYGKQNILLLLVTVAIVLASGLWPSKTVITLLGVPVLLSNLLRDLGFLIITLCSVWLTPKQVRQSNQFVWQPIIEVGKLFMAIFITIAPVIAILKAGESGALSALIALVSDENGQPINERYFWLSGMLSGFLDNAPTYLVFFNLASGEADTLMFKLPETLLAISMGSVFMGALTYIGNAPNLMVKSIAEQHKITMPGFFGYMKWSFILLLPTFWLLMLVLL